MGLDPGGDADEHPWHRARGGVQRIQAVHLVEGVDDDPPDPLVDRHGQLDVALVVPVHHQAVGGHACVQRQEELTTGGHVYVHALLVGEPGHGPAEERLARICHPATEGGHCLAAPRPEVRLVVDEQGRAELVRQGHEVATPDRRTTAPVDGRGVGQEVRWERPGHQASVSPAGTSSRHITSGAPTPRRSSATTNPTRAASTNHSLAWVMPSSTSSPSTRQSW